MAWTKISPEEARQTRYYGFGGWLLTFYLLLLTYLLLWIPQFFLGAPPDWDQDLYFAALISRTVLWLPFLLLGPLEHPMMPRIAILMMWFSLGSTWTIGFFGSTSHPVTWIPSMVLGVGFASLMTWYFRSSRRVNVTYRHRVWTEPKSARFFHPKS